MFGPSKYQFIEKLCGWEYLFQNVTENLISCNILLLFHLGMYDFQYKECVPLFS